MTRSARWARAVRSGAGALNRERWAAAVDRAAQRVSERFGSHAFEPATPGEPLGRHVLVGPGDVVVDAQLLLDAERALAEAEQATDEQPTHIPINPANVDIARAAGLDVQIWPADFETRPPFRSIGDDFAHVEDRRKDEP